MLQIAICDDLPEERELLRHFLEHYFTGLEYHFQITEYTCGEALCADYEDADVAFDLIFLDIFMDGINGIDVAHSIRKQHCNAAIIFLTTTPNYALEGYDVHAIGYLVKPLDAQKASALLYHFLQQEYAGTQKYLLIKEGVRLTRISCREIYYLESQRDVLLVHTAKQTHRLYKTMTEAEAELKGYGFLRCHNSFLVNLAKVHCANVNEFVLPEGMCVPIRRRDAKSLRKAYVDYLLQQEEFSML